MTVPASVTVAATATTASFTATAAKVTTAQTAIITATLNGASKTANLSLNSLVTPTSLACAPASITSGGVSTCTVTTSGAAPTGGLAVVLSSNSGWLTVPASVTVGSGATTASFKATAGNVTNYSVATLTATANGASATSTMILTSSASLSSLACGPASLTGAGTSSCTVTLSGAAPTGGAVVALSDNSASVTVPASVTVAAAATTASFTATAVKVTSAQTAVITATLNGNSQTASLSLSPLVTVTAVACTPTSLASGASSTCTITLSGAAPSNCNPVTLTSNATLLTVPASVAISTSATSATFTAKAGTISAAQTAVVTATMNGASTTSSVALTTATSTTCPCSVWKSTSVPTLVSDSDTTPVELGMKFKSKVAGYILGVRFYKGSMNTGTHVGHLWTSGGTLLASVTFANETASGWQQANFAKPVAVTANTTYVVSYWAPVGRYADDSSYFTASGVDNGPLHAMKDGEVGNNNVYTYTKSTFPSSSWNASNYWGDVVFNTVASTTPTAVASSVSQPTTAKSAMSLSAAAVQSSVASATTSTSARSLSCAPSAVAAGGSFTCELRLASHGGSSPATFAVASSGSDLRLPATISARAGQNSIQFRGTVDSAAPQSLLGIAVGDPGSQTETQIAVLPSQAPVFSLPTTLLVKPGEPISFRVAAQDPAGLPVRISASKLPAGASFEPASNRFTWTPASNQLGVFTLQFSALNSTGFSASAQSEITVASDQPVLASSSKLACSPGAIASLTGNWLSLSDQDLSDPTGASRQLGGTSVQINGEPAPVLYASPTRVEFQCPNSAAGTGLSLTLETESGSTAQLHATMLEAKPVLLLAQGASQNQGQIALAGTDTLATARDSVASGQPAQLDDLISIRATGLGANPTAASISVKLNGIDAQVQSILPAPDAAGVFLITVRIPTAAPVGDAVPLLLEMISATGHHLASNQVTLAIE